MHVVTGLSFHKQLPEMQIHRKILGSKIFFGITNERRIILQMVDGIQHFVRSAVTCDVKTDNSHRLSSRNSVPLL